MALLSLGAASASAAVMVFYLHNLGGGGTVGRLSGEYQLKFQMSIAMAYMSWVTSGISTLVMLWNLSCIENILPLCNDHTVASCIENMLLSFFAF